MSMRKSSCSAVIAVCALLAGLASANTIPPKLIDFSSKKLGGVNVSGGTVGLVGPGEQLQVLNGPIESMIPINWPHAYSVTGGYIDVITGDCILNCAFYKSKSGVGGAQFSDVGSSIKLYGSIPGLPGDPSGLLFSGVFGTVGSKLFGEAHCGTDTHVSLNKVKTGETAGLGGCVEITSANTLLLADLGIPSYFRGGTGYVDQLYLDLSLLTTFSGKVGSSDVIIEPLPEPASLALLGVGLLGLGALVRRTLARH